MGIRQRAVATKNLVQPDAEQIAKLEKYVSTALWGDLSRRLFVPGGNRTHI